MKIFHFLLFVPSFAIINQKLCIHCKYFIPDTNSIKLSKCEMFPKVENKLNYLVSGIEEEEYNYCVTSRGDENICGEDAKMYKKKHISKYKDLSV